MRRRSFIATATGAVAALFWKPAAAERLYGAPWEYRAPWETFARYDENGFMSDIPYCDACCECAIGYGLQNDFWDFDWFRDADGYELCPDCAAKPERERWEE